MTGLAVLRLTPAIKYPYPLTTAVKAAVAK